MWGKEWQRQMERDTLVWCHNISVRAGWDEKKSRYWKKKKKKKNTSETHTRELNRDKSSVICSDPPHMEKRINVKQMLWFICTLLTTQQVVSPLSLLQILSRGPKTNNVAHIQYKLLPRAYLSKSLCFPCVYFNKMNMCSKEPPPGWDWKRRRRKKKTQEAH